MDLSTATVFVTGANRGIGLALIQELRKRGARRIYAAARNPDPMARQLGALWLANPRQLEAQFAAM